MKITLPGARVAFGAIVLSTVAVGCPCIDDTVNSSPWLKWKIFATFGAGRLCDEMLKRGAPLRLSDGGPVLGRFYPTSCQTQTNDDRQTVSLQLGGDGYAWTPITRRMSFSSFITVEYKPDFHKDGGTVYVWFNPAGPATPTFNLGYVEQPVVGFAMAVLSPVTAGIAQSIMASMLGRGFTVIHESGGDDFSMGILQPGQRPSHPWTTHGSDRVVYANETTEVHQEQLDFLGPFDVDDTGRTLFIRMRVSGPPVDVAVVPRDSGEIWRRQYQSGPGVPLPPAPPFVAAPLQPEMDLDRSVALPKGQWYVVVDNSASVGQVSPPPGLGLVDNVARLSYLVSLGDTP